MSILGYWAVLQPIALNFGTQVISENGQLDTNIPAKTEDVEVDSIVEKLEVVGHSSKDLASQLRLKQV